MSEDQRSLMYLSPQLIKRQFHCKVAVSTILTTKTCIICLHEVQAADLKKKKNSTGSGNDSLIKLLTQCPHIGCSLGRT